MLKFLSRLTSYYYFLLSLITYTILTSQQAKANNIIKIADNNTASQFSFDSIKNFFTNLDISSLSSSVNNFINSYIPSLQDYIGDNLMLSFISILVILILLLIFIKILRVVIGIVFGIFILYLLYSFFIN